MWPIVRDKFYIATLRQTYKTEKLLEAISCEASVSYHLFFILFNVGLDQRYQINWFLNPIGHAQGLHLKNTTLEPGTELFIRFPTKSGTKFLLISGEMRKIRTTEWVYFLKDSEIVYDNFWPSKVISFMKQQWKWRLILLEQEITALLWDFKDMRVLAFNKFIIWLGKYNFKTHNNYFYHLIRRAILW